MADITGKPIGFAFPFTRRYHYLYESSTLLSPLYVASRASVTWV
jgi:hypothetical protein